MNDFTSDAIKYTDGHAVAVRDVVAIESPLQININDKPFSMTMRTPGADRALVRGLLFTEGILKAKAAFDYVDKAADQPLGMATANVKLPANWQDGHEQNRSLMSSAACGICGKTTWKDPALGEMSISATAALDVLSLPKMFKAMYDQQKMFHTCGGTHASKKQSTKQITRALSAKISSAATLTSALKLSAEQEHTSEVKKLPCSHPSKDNAPKFGSAPLPSRIRTLWQTHRHQQR